MTQPFDDRTFEAASPQELLQYFAIFFGKHHDQPNLVHVRGKQFQMHIAKDDLPIVGLVLRENMPIAFLTMVAVDLREQTGMFQLRYVFGIEHTSVTIEIIVDVDVESCEYPSITHLFPVANWYEREAHDMMGLIPHDHPDPRRLVVHHNWPEHIFPLRRDVNFTDFPPFENDDESFHNRVQGEGIMEIPVGPIHAGIIEPGHFRFSAVGEQVINLEARLFYTHRGVEKQLEGMPIDRARLLIERTCAACTVSSTLAYCQALEDISGTEITLRAAYLRVIFAELERLYNHVGDTGNLCAGIGFHMGSMEGASIKESLLVLNESLSGSRFLFGVLEPGGVLRDIDSKMRWQILQLLDRVLQQFQRLVNMIEGSVGAMDRFTNTGVVSLRSARELGAVGVAARASGIAHDVRVDRPYAAYAHVASIQVPVRESGDVLARFQVRAAETFETLRILKEMLATMPAGDLTVSLGDLPSFSTGFSITESPRGSNCHWLMTGRNHTIYRYRIRTASYANWPIVPRAALNNIVPDFPLINKSFELCYSCLDR